MAALALGPLGKFGQAIISKAMHKRFEYEVIPGISLPKDKPFLSKVKNVLDLNFKTNIDVVGTLVKPGSTQNSIGKLLQDEERFTPEDMKNFRILQQKAINNIIKVKKDDPGPMDGYLWFGNKNYVKNLGLLNKENPFFAMALTAGSDDDGEYLELNSFSTSGELDSKFAKYMAPILDEKRFINVRFNLDMDVTQVSYKEDGKEVIADKKDWDYYCSGAIFNQVYFASAIHATIHVLHYILTTAIEDCTKHDTSLSTWAMPYDENIAVKYVEVGLLLIKPEVGTTFADIEVKGVKPFDKSQDDYFVTGCNGFGVKSGAIDAYLKEAWINWGHCKTVDDFMEGFLLEDLYKSPNGKEIMEKAGILGEFNKLAATIKPFAEELTGAMKESDEAAFETAEKNLKKFLENCGDGVCDIDNISSWVQLMSITGMVHGSTLSYTRTIIMPEVVRWRQIQDKTWTENDCALMEMFSTAQGMEVGRHVLTDALPNSVKKEWDTSKIAPGVFDVMKKYNDINHKLKEDSQKELESKPEFLREYGWIMSDWCPDGYDGKQMTIATYI